MSLFLCVDAQYEEDAEIEELRGLLVTPSQPDVTSPQNTEEALSDGDSNKDDAERCTLDDVTSKMAETTLDSDDDLEPFDLSNDTHVTSCEPPRYVRQCMAGALEICELHFSSRQVQMFS